MDVRIGRVVKSHGIKGEVVVDATTDAPEIRFAPGSVLTGRQGGSTTELTVASVREHKNRLLVLFEEITDRTRADRLRGMVFDAPPLDDDSGEEGFYDHELQGLDVICDGATIGTVTGTVTGPGGTLLEVGITDTGKQVLVPFVHAIVPTVDVAGHSVTITPPEGLLDL
ncbi:ribosome maturation factor RimM [Corynebacterium mendelii]|uniref:Ribosome maturation factor RimM n=1 Tax=Corynebacterium mendelii TaxID=2765362 RepID=A0A939DXS0_9CORY|nr:ribosome maturation factor RimM [Corynebacterium mendelii]MBN9643180.1 ribosome maturation factor RimM [Corynebacterium mendelii]